MFRGLVLCHNGVMLFCERCLPTFDCTMLGVEQVSKVSLGTACSSERCLPTLIALFVSLHNAYVARGRVKQLCQCPLLSLRTESEPIGTDRNSWLHLTLICAQRNNSESEKTRNRSLQATSVSQRKQPAFEQYAIQSRQASLKRASRAQ